MPEFEQGIDVESRTSPKRETSPQVFGPGMQPFLENQTRKTPVQCLNDSKKPQPEIQRNETHMTTNGIGDDKISSPKIKSSQI